MKINDVILQTVTKFVVFIILVFAIFLLFSGHHHPGGGFIGGLVTASAFVLLYLAFDIDGMKRVVPFDFIKMTAVGLLIAVMTGVGSFLFGAPFLSHAFGYVDLPLFGDDTELATAVLFDIGVYLTVIGITMTILITIGEDQK